MTDQFIDLFLPYCLARQADGRYAVLNRRYQPVGHTMATHVAQAALTCLVSLPALDPKMAARISANASPDTGRVYLYSDGTHPALSPQHWHSYAQRLATLARLQVSA